MILFHFIYILDNHHIVCRSLEEIQNRTGLVLVDYFHHVFCFLQCHVSFGFVSFFSQ